VGVRGYSDGNIIKVGKDKAPRYRGVCWANVEEEEEGGDRGLWWGA